MPASPDAPLGAVTFNPIGVIHTPFMEIRGMPLQAIAAADIRGTIELAPAYAEGLQDLEAFSHLIVLFHLHGVQGASLRVTPYLDDQQRGIFATRSPKRPNPIGFSVVKLVEVRGTTLVIMGVDMLDGTPLLDLKPYVPAFDSHQTDRIGWFADRIERVHSVRADERFQ
jgi:tRNA-Thr(GGU) m(6)t(6)A37 methyltransferase TsaA